MGVGERRGRARRAHHRHRQQHHRRAQQRRRRNRRHHHAHSHGNTGARVGIFRAFSIGAGQDGAPNRSAQLFLYFWMVSGVFILIGLILANIGGWILTGLGIAGMCLFLLGMFSCVFIGVARRLKAQPAAPVDGVQAEASAATSVTSIQQPPQPGVFIVSETSGVPGQGGAVEMHTWTSVQPGPPQSNVPMLPEVAPPYSTSTLYPSGTPVGQATVVAPYPTYPTNPAAMPAPYPATMPTPYPAAAAPVAAGDSTVNGQPQTVGEAVAPPPSYDDVITGNINYNTGTTS